MQGYRGLWSVGLALSLSGCAGTAQQRVAGTSAPSQSPLASARERMTTRLIAWRQRLAPPKGVAPKVDPAKVEEPVEETTASVTKARVKAGDALRARNDAPSDRLSHYFPMLNRQGGPRAKGAPDAPPARDLWAESARLALARNGIDLPARAGGGPADDPSVLPVALEVGTTGTSVRPRAASPVTSRRGPRPVMTTTPKHDADAVTLPAVIEAAPGARVERTSAELASPRVSGEPAPDSPPAVQGVAYPSPEPMPDPDESVTRTQAPAPAPAPAPVESAPIPAPAPKPADEPVPPAGVAGETAPEPPPAAATAPEPPAASTSAPGMTAPEAPAAQASPALLSQSVPYAAPSKSLPVAPSKALPLAAPSKSLPAVPAKSLPAVAPSKALPTAQDHMASGSRVRPKGPARRSAVAASLTAAGRPRLATAPAVAPLGTPTDPAGAPGGLSPASYYVNPGADAAHRAPAGTADPSLKTSALPADGAPPVSTYWGRPTARRRTILSRLIARFQGDKPASAVPSSVAGAEPRDLAEGGGDVQRVAAQRVGEPAQR